MFSKILPILKQKLHNLNVFNLPNVCIRCHCQCSRGLQQNHRRWHKYRLLMTALSLHIRRSTSLIKTEIPTNVHSSMLRAYFPARRCYRYCSNCCHFLCLLLELGILAKVFGRLQQHRNADANKSVCIFDIYRMCGCMYCGAYEHLPWIFQTNLLNTHVCFVCIYV